MSQMNFGSILHASILVSDTQRALAFYRDILGLPVLDNRPDLGFPGAWLSVGGQQIHLLQLPNPDPVSGRPQHGGRDRHIAIAVGDFQQLIRILDEHDQVYTLSKSGRAALFIRDPDGNALEFVAQ